MRLAAPGEIGKLGAAGKNAMGAQMNVVAAIFVVQNFAVAGHQNRNRIREQQHTRGQRAGESIETFVTNSGVFQVHRIHEVMQRDVRVAPAQAGQQGRRETGKSHQRTASEGAEQKVEPNHVRLKLVQRAHQAQHAAGVVEGPAALDGKTFEFLLFRREFIRQNG